MSNQKQIFSAIVLAAGSSARMGNANKLLLRIDNKPVVVHAIESLLKGGVDEAIVILGHEEKRIREILPKQIKIAANADYQQGMATSIRCGMQNLSSNASAVYIALADMPFISPKTIRAMIRVFQNAKRPAIVVPFYHGRPGHPVLFDRHFFSELSDLQGDHGAKSILRNYRKNILRYDCDDPAILQDIDTPEAFAKLSRTGASLRYESRNTKGKS